MCRMHCIGLRDSHVLFILCGRRGASKIAWWLGSTECLMRPSIWILCPRNCRTTYKISKSNNEFLIRGPRRWTRMSIHMRSFMGVTTRLVKLIHTSLCRRASTSFWSNGTSTPSRPLRASWGSSFLRAQRKLSKLSSTSSTRSLSIMQSENTAYSP